MPRFTATLEGLAAFREKCASAASALRDDLADASFDAAAAGVEAATDMHTYEDHTYQLTERGIPRREYDNATSDLIAEMIWEAEYASFVDEGTVRSKAYPFTPAALAAAEPELDRLAGEAAERFRTRIEEG